MRYLFNVGREVYVSSWGGGAGRETWRAVYLVFVGGHSGQVCPRLPCARLHPSPSDVIQAALTALLGNLRKSPPRTCAGLGTRSAGVADAPGR